jgi:hypothetical protein
MFEDSIQTDLMKMGTRVRTRLIASGEGSETVVTCLSFSMRGYYYNKLIRLFIYVFPQQPKGQLWSKHEQRDK